jgi:small-conductance mechanosensitive channel
MTPRDRTVLILGLAAGVVPALMVALVITSMSGSLSVPGIVQLVGTFGVPAGLVWALFPLVARRIVRAARGSDERQMLSLFIGIVIAAIVLVVTGYQIGGQLFGGGLAFVTVISGLAYCGIMVAVIIRSVPKPSAKELTASDDAS